MADNITPRGFVIGGKKADDNADANVFVESLFFNYIGKRISIDTVAFRREMVLTVMKAFGEVPNFNHWYRNQFTSPYLSDLHVEFLRDTIRYLLTGTRKYSLEVWDSIIKRGEIVTPNAGDDDEDERKFFGISSSGVYRKPKIVKIPDIVTLFMEKKNGAADLLYTAYILFGKDYSEREARYDGE